MLQGAQRDETAGAAQRALGSLSVPSPSAFAWVLISKLQLS